MKRTGNLLHVSLIFTTVCVIVAAQGNYKLLNLESPELCSEISERKIKLDDNKSGLIVTQKRINYHVLPWISNLKCHFEVKAVGRHNGIVAVIQNISLRKNETTSNCVDFIQFRKKNGATSSKMCGQLSAETSMNPLYASDPIGSSQSTTSTFVDEFGSLHVTVFISKEPLALSEQVDLVIVFTLYKSCNQVSSDYFHCDDPIICIHNSYVDDGYVNCPNFECIDENGCMYKEENDKESIGNKVLIGSISSLFLIFVIFIICLFVCKKHKTLCWADVSGTAPSPPRDRTSRVVEMNDSPRQSQNIGATGPPVVGGNQMDKDLPPSYESLFPSR